MSTDPELDPHPLRSQPTWLNPQQALTANLIIACLFLLYASVDFFSRIFELFTLNASDFMLVISVFYGAIFYFGLSCLVWLSITPDGTERSD